MGGPRPSSALAAARHGPTPDPEPGPGVAEQPAETVSRRLDVMVADPHRGGPRAGNEHVAVGGQRTRVKGDKQVGFQGEPSGKPGADQLVAELAALLPAGAGNPEHAIVDVRWRRRGLGQGRPGCRDDRRDRGDRVERRRVTTAGRTEAEALAIGRHDSGAGRGAADIDGQDVHGGE